MKIALAQIWRHPIKAHGAEALEAVRVEAGKTLPWDRSWAIAHEGAKARGGGWANCANFSRGAKTPSLMAIDASLDEAQERITLRHPDRPDITVHPDRDSAALLDWVKPLMPPDRAQSNAVVRVSERGMTDTDFPSIAIANLASNRALSEGMGQDLSPLRWRANLWLDGMPAWEEAFLVGKSLVIGEAVFEVREQITRCLATAANPETGRRDVDTLGALKQLGHQEFGVYAVVTKPGTISCGDTIQIV